MGEYEPNDSRNVHGTARTQDGRWTGEARAIDANGNPQSPQAEQQQSSQNTGFGSEQGANSGTEEHNIRFQGDPGSAQQVQFEPDPSLDNQAGMQAGQSGMSGASGADRGDGQQQRFQRESGQMGGSDPAGTFGIRQHMEVVDADGSHVGTIDHIDGDRIKLTRRDQPPGHEGHDHHHYLSLGDVERVEADQVHLRRGGSGHLQES